jgi:hypothetical protein
MLASNTSGRCVILRKAINIQYYPLVSRRSFYHLVPLHSISCCSIIAPRTTTTPTPTTNRSSSSSSNNSNNMKFYSSTLSLLALSIPATTITAWSPLNQIRPVASPFFSRTTTALFSAIAGSYSTEQMGESATESFRLQFKGGDEGTTTISPWHDIPLEGSSGYNMVVEIPKMTKVRI